ncbi:hypothetical protein D3C71_1352480 [compost metagenome]
MAVRKSPVSGQRLHGLVDEIEAAPDLDKPDFLAFSLSRLEPVAPLVVDAVVGDRSFCVLGLIVRLLNRQHMIVDHAPGDERAGELRRYSDGEQQQGCDECGFGLQGVLQ